MAGGEAVTPARQPRSAPESNEVAALGLLQLVVANNGTRTYQRAKQDPYSGPHGCAATSTPAAGDEADHCPRTRLDLGAQKSLCVHRRFQHGLSMQVECGVHGAGG